MDKTACSVESNERSREKVQGPLASTRPIGPDSDLDVSTNSSSPTALWCDRFNVRCTVIVVAFVAETILFLERFCCHARDSETLLHWPGIEPRPRVAGENSTTEPPMLEEFAKHALICWQDEGMTGIWPMSCQHT